MKTNLWSIWEWRFYTGFTVSFQIPVTYEFINKLDENTYCKPWLKVTPFKSVITPGRWFCFVTLNSDLYLEASYPHSLVLVQPNMRHKVSTQSNNFILFIFTEPRSAYCISWDREFDHSSVAYFPGDWSWNNFYGHSPPFADSRRVVASCKGKYVHEVLANCLVELAEEKSVARWTDRPDTTIAVESTWVRCKTSAQSNIYQLEAVTVLGR